MSVGRTEIAIQMLGEERPQGFRRQFRYRNQGSPL
jgi:hypothetical protein